MLVVLGRRVGAELAPHPVDPLVGDPASGEQGLGHHPVVALGIVGPDGPLVAEPQMDPGPIEDSVGQHVVGAARGGPAGEPQIRAPSSDGCLLEHAGEPAAAARAASSSLGLDGEEGRHGASTLAGR